MQMYTSLFLQYQSVLFQLINKLYTLLENLHGANSAEEGFYESELYNNIIPPPEEFLEGLKRAEYETLIVRDTKTHGKPVKDYFVTPGNVDVPSQCGGFHCLPPCTSRINK